MVKSSSVLAFHYAARAVLLAGFAFLIVHLVRSGNLNLYIAQRMQLIVKLAALGMYAVAAHQLYSAIRAFFDKEHNEPSCDCLHEMPATWGKSALLYGWFALPLLIGYIVPDSVLGSSMASAKGVQFTPQTTVVSEPRTTVRSDSAPEPSVELPDADGSTTGPGSAAADPEKGQPDNALSELAQPEEPQPSGAPPGTGSVPSDDVPPNDAQSNAGQSSDAQSNAGQSNDADSNRKLTPEELDQLFPFDNFTETYAAYGKKLLQRDVIEVTPKRYIETLTTIDLYREAFLGKTIEVSGFVYREGNMGPKQFGVSRFAISCCTADASPYGVMVTFGKADTLETDEWVSVTGKLGTTLYNDIEIIQIDVVKVVKIPAPDDPYVSPDFDFGLDQLE